VLSGYDGLMRYSNESQAAGVGAPGAPIIVDVDSTLYDAETLILDAARRRYGLEIRPEQRTRWNAWAADLSGEQLRTLIEQDLHDPATIMAVVPYEGAVETLLTWQTAGHPLHVITHRAPEREAVTRAWLSSIGIHPKVLIAVRRFDKAAYARSVGAALLVDDKPKTILDALAAGIRPATIVCLYNADLLAKLGDQVIAADDWPALARAVRDSDVLG